MARDLLEPGGVSVAGVATGSAQALSSARELQPDVTPVDLDLGDESGFDLAQQLAGITPSALSPVILICAYREEDFRDLIQASPAMGFVPKSRLSSAAIAQLFARAIDGGGPGNV